MISRSTWHKAKKEHRCSCCRGLIQIGERYHYTFSIEPEPMTTKLHRFCKEAVLDPIILEEGGYFEWDPPQDFHAWRQNFWEKHGLSDLKLAEEIRLIPFYPPWMWPPGLTISSRNS